MIEAYGTLYNAVDIAAAAYLILGLLVGLKRGLSGELARLASAAVTLALTLHYYAGLADYLARNTRLAQHEALARPLAFFILALCSGLFFLTLRLILQHLMKITFNPKIDRAAGLLAGGARAVATVALVVLALGLWPSSFLRRVFREESAVGRTLFTTAPALAARVQDALAPTPEPGPEPAPDTRGP
jgi:uncharacterized membrane protein required for colicin V production